MPPRIRSTAVALVIGIALTVGSLTAQVSQASLPQETISPAATSTHTHYWSEVHTASGTRIQGKSLAQLTDDSIVVTGNFTTQAVFPTGPNEDDSIVLTSAGEFDIFVAQLDTKTGYFTWAQRAGGTGSDIGYDVAASADDTAIITGFIQGTAQFPTGPNADDSIVVTSNGYQDIFVAGLDRSTGYFTWAQRAGGSGSFPVEEDLGYSVAVRDDTVIVTGEFEGTATFPSGPSTTLTVTSPIGSSVYVASIDPVTGYFTWVQWAGGSGGNEGQSVAITSDGRPVLTGRISFTAYFPSGPGDDSIAVTGQGSDIFVAGMNADDSYFDWVQLAGGSGTDEGLSLVVTADDTPVITGRFVNAATFPTGPAADDSIQLNGDGIDVFVAALNADDSYFAWAQRATGSDTSSGRSLALTTSESPIVTGSFKEELVLPTGPGSSDSITLDSPGNTDAFVAGFDPATGYFTWAQQAGGTTAGINTSGEGVIAMNGRTPMVTGSFGATAIFPSGPSATLTRTAQPVGATANLFIGQLAPFTPDPTPPAPTFPPSAPRDVAAEPGDASATVSWAAPSSAGSFPISTYQVQLSPGGLSCLVPASRLECDITGLVNGTTYTASVRALNGAGWGPYSVVSEPFTPRASMARTITITGTRGEVRGRPGVVVQGATTGMTGDVVTAMVRLRGQTSYTAGSSRLIDEQGTFTWQRRTSTKVYVYFRGDSVRSNRVIIPAR